MTALRAGDPVQVGAYDVLGRLAAGGQGVVFLGRSAQGRSVAVKLLHRGDFGTEGASSALQREVAAAQQVAPFCTAQLIEARLDADPPYIVSEYVDGPSLSQYVAQTGPLSGAALDRLAIASATALVAVHRAGVVHRDLKPGNILLGPDGPRVIDFGIARHQSSHTLSTTSVVGTPMYMAPEQFEGLPASPASDVFAWAATLAFAATGRAPFAAETLPAVMFRIVSGHADLDGVPEPLLAVVRSCLVTDPLERPTAVAVLMQLLGHERAPADPLDALHEATRALAVRPAPEPPTVNRVPPVVQAPAPVQAPVPVQAPAAGQRGRVLAAVMVILVVGVGVAGWTAYDVLRTTLSGASAGDAAVAPTRSTASTGEAPGVLAPEGPSPDLAVTSSAETPTSIIPTGPALPIPAGFAGTWKGNENQLGFSNYAATLTLTAGALSGTYTATGELFGIECVSTVSAVSTSGDVLVLREELNEEKSSLACSRTGLLTLTRSGATSLDLEWKDGTNPSNTATGSLSRA